MTDSWGHEAPTGGGAFGSQLTTSNITADTSAGTSATIAFTSGVATYDMAGQFEVHSGSANTAAGTVAIVAFQESFTRPPCRIGVSVIKASDGTPVLAAASSITAAGFKVSVATALTASTTYNVTYDVIP